MASVTATVWLKVTAAVSAIGVGAPYLLYKTLPTTEDLAKRYPEDYSPSAVKDRERNAVAMQEYLNKMKEYSKDNRNIWIVMKEEQDKARKAYAKADRQKQQSANEQKAARQAEIRRELESGS